jgi:hypothetical protein
MPRLPSKEEERASQEEDLKELWAELCASPEMHRFGSGVSVHVCSGYASPHFHLLGANCCGIVALNGLTVIGGEVPLLVLAEAKKWVGHPANSQRLLKEWERLKRLMDSDRFFPRLEHKIGAKLDTRFRLRVVRTMVSYCDSIRRLEWSDPRVRHNAKRLVVTARGRVAALCRILEQFDPDKQTVSEFYSAGLDRECWAVYMSLKERYDELSGLENHQPWRLAGISEPVFEALSKFDPPFWAVDRNDALSKLDKQLASWSGTTNSKRGKRLRDTIVDEFIIGLEHVFKSRPSTANNHFVAFLRYLIGALPMHLRPDDGRALTARVNRLKPLFNQTAEFMF